MKWHHRFAAPALALALALSSAPAAPDEQVADAGAPPDAAPPPDDAAPPEEQAAPAPPPLFLDPPPEARSKPPTSKEWEAEKDFQLARGAIACSTRRVREWVRVRCLSRAVQSASLIAGTSPDTYFSIRTRVECMDDPTMEEGERCWDQAEVLFPIRRGDRRVVQIKQQLPGYGYGFAGTLSDTERTLFVISETWLDGDPGPVVSVTES